MCQPQQLLLPRGRGARYDGEEEQREITMLYYYFWRETEIHPYTMRNHLCKMKYLKLLGNSGATQLDLSVHAS